MRVCIAPPASAPRPTPQWRRANWDEVCRIVAALPLDTLDAMTADEAVTTVSQWLRDVIKNHIPHRLPRVYKFPQYYQHDTLLALRNKYSAFLLKKSHPNNYTCENFRRLRTLAKRLVRRDTTNYINSITDEIKVNPKRFFSLINSRRKSPRIPSDVSLGDNNASNEERSELFNNFFASNFSSVNIDIDNLNIVPVTNGSLCNFSTSSIEILKLINQIPISRGSGIDEITAVFIKNCSEPLSELLCYLFNRCFLEGCYPSDWKNANVVPILKTGSKSDVANYRPISMLPIFSNIFEKIICHQLMAFVHPYLNESQHGFVPSRSCLTNLSVLLQDATNAIHTCDQLDTLHIDLLKAFDRVPHAALKHILKYRFGITGHALKVLSSFLSQRKQRVVIDGHASSWADVTSGVPQGSVLGPLLFVLYIDDLHSVLSPYDCKLLLYADDSKLYKLIRTVLDCIMLQRALDAFGEWCLLHGLAPNVKKCGVISFSLREKNLITFDYILSNMHVKRLSSVNDLGVIFDSKLLFVKHIESCKAKAMQLLGMLYRFTDITSIDALRTFFMSFVYPTVNYCSSVWSSASNSNLNLLNRVMSFFCNIVRKRVPHYRDMTTTL